MRSQACDQVLQPVLPIHRGSSLLADPPNQKCARSRMHPIVHRKPPGNTPATRTGFGGAQVLQGCTQAGFRWSHGSRQNTPLLQAPPAFRLLMRWVWCCRAHCSSSLTRRWRRGTWRNRRLKGPWRSAFLHPPPLRRSPPSGCFWGRPVRQLPLDRPIRNTYRRYVDRLHLMGQIGKFSLVADA